MLMMIIYSREGEVLVRDTDPAAVPMKGERVEVAIDGSITSGTVVERGFTYSAVIGNTVHVHLE